MICLSFCESIKRLIKTPTIYDVLLAHAAAMPLPAVLDRRLGPQKECFANAAKRVIRHRNGGQEVVYCEGYAVAEEIPIPLEHAWLLIGSGSSWQVVETTWEEPGVEYFGLAFDGDYLRATLVRKQTYGLLGDQWFGDGALVTMPAKQLDKCLHPVMKLMKQPTSEPPSKSQPQPAPAKASSKLQHS